ncbi:hypothetical protein FDECE_11391 [Fusarium decemcellulare]|nr:hypothetical protein FDECE_11391 [Fusarium decemcellulare]
MQSRRFLATLVLLLSRFCSSEAASIPESVQVYPRSDNDNQTDQIPAWIARCMYPISGSYTQFQRILFYIVVIVVILFRFHKWVLVTGAAWLVGCIVPAAIHCVAMSFESNIGLDADLIPSSTILRTGFMATIIFALYPSDVYQNSTLLIWIGTWLLLICDNLFIMRQMVGGYHAMLVLSNTNCSDASIFECSTACYQTHPPTLFRAPDDRMMPLAWHGPFMIDDPGLTSGNGTNQGGEGTSTGGNTLNVFSIEDYGAGIANQTASFIIFWILLSIFMLTASLGALFPPRVSRNWVMRRISNGFPRDGDTNYLSHNLKIVLTVVAYIWEILSVIAFPLFIVDILVQFLLASMSVSKRKSKSWILSTPSQL